jgi:pyrimidine deaminase RibD-like protein
MGDNMFYLFLEPCTKMGKSGQKAGKIGAKCLKKIVCRGKMPDM